MFLIKSQLDNVNTTLRLNYYDNRHKDEWLDAGQCIELAMNNAQYTIGIEPL